MSAHDLDEAAHGSDDAHGSDQADDVTDDAAAATEGAAPDGAQEANGSPPPPIGGPSAAHRRWRPSRIWWVTGPLLVLSWLGAIVLLCLPAPYTIESPGATYDTRSLVDVQKGTPTYRHPGEIRFVAVSETVRPSYYQVLTGWLSSAVDVFPTAVASEGRTNAQDRRYSAVLMSNSKQSAAFQALTKLGYAPQKQASGVFVNQVVEGAPADGALQAGDTITAIAKVMRTSDHVTDTSSPGRTADTVAKTTTTTTVETTMISATQDLTAFLTGVKPGQRVELTVDRPGVSLHKKVSLTLGSREVDGERKPYVGITMETRPHFNLPFSVDFDTGDVGGPSAGLALTLSLIDKLSKDDLTKGHTVAVTGTMELDGNVGPIGGIRQKTMSVAASGAGYFLVPTENAAQARAVAGKRLKVIGVGTLDEALKALRGLPPAKSGG